MLPLLGWALFGDTACPVLRVVLGAAHSHGPESPGQGDTGRPPAAQELGQQGSRGCREDGGGRQYLSLLCLSLQAVGEAVAQEQRPQAAAAEPPLALMKSWPEGERTAPAQHP